MADLLYGIARDALNLTTGNQTFTDSNFGGATPKGAILLVSGATANNTLTLNKRWGLGMTDGTTEGCIYGFSQDNVSPSQAERAGSTTKVIALTDTNDSTLDFAATFVSFGTNNITINITNAPTSAYILTVILFGGTDLSAHVATPLLPNAVDSTVTVTPNFPSDVVIMGYGDNNMDESTTDVFDRLSWGACVDDGSLSQMCIETESEDNRVNQEVQGHFDTGRIGHSVGGSESIELTSITATTYVLTTRESSINENALCLALDLGGGSYKLSLETTPTAIQEDTYTTTFEPGLVLFGMSNVTTGNLNTDITASGDIGSIGLAAITESDEISYNFTDDYGTNPSNSNCHTDVNIITQYTDDVVTVKYEGTPSIISTGFRINYTGVDASARNFWYLAFEKGTGAAAQSMVYKSNAQFKAMRGR